MNQSGPNLWRAIHLAGGTLIVVGFILLVGRFWHPYYGFTKFVQLDELDARSGIHEVRENPVFVYPGENGYDGAAYTQIAFHPLLDSAELQPAIGNVPYRARRILGSALAWVIAGGQAAHIANAYASLNVAVWLALAIVLWRVLPVVDGRSWLAWAGAMLSAGVLHSVRLALTDLLATMLVVAAIAWHERNRTRPAWGALAAAGLARETALANVVALWRGSWRSPRTGIATALATVLVAVPLAAWMGYVRWKAGPAAQGFGNFTWPVVGWVEKWRTTLADFGRQPHFLWLNTTTLLALTALTVQAAFFLSRRRSRDPWWRVGAIGVAMMALLGTSVWEGHPGAATRVLLPMTVAFAVLVVRERVGWAWIAGGSLSVFSGVLALWHVPHDPAEIAAGRSGRGSYVVRLADGWFGVERSRGTAWAWAGQQGELRVMMSPPPRRDARLRVKLRAITPREITISHRGRTLWEGTVGEKAEWVTVVVPASDGAGDRVLALTLASGTAPTAESNHPSARALGFAVYGVTLE